MEYMGRKVTIGKLGLNQRTEEGNYYPMVDGEKVGEKGRAFFWTPREAVACAKRFILAMENTK
jgi:hypothetical protein